MLLLTVFVLSLCQSFVTAEYSSAPTAAVKNGTYTGIHSSIYDQDFFLGIPYAQPPIGNLRFRNPQSLNEMWTESRSASVYSDECYGYGSDQWNYEVSEDCLYMNIVRPSGYEGHALPVAFWIHGGGFFEGGGVDQRYNLSFMVQNSVNIGKPIIGVSINYRLSAWGFLYSDEVFGSGQTNVGLRDQRLALHWVQENIAAFGGDPSKVTIWGESAGGASVGFHLTAYGGRDDGLFRGAMMESGNPVPYSALPGTYTYQPLYNAIVSQAGCNGSLDTLQCLRQVPNSTLNSIINSTTLVNGQALTAFSPSLDGDFVQRYSSLQLAAGQFVHVPIISGANSDEGTAFSPTGVNTTQDLYNDIIKTGVPPTLANQLLEAYPDDPSVNVVADLGLSRPGLPFGAQFRRSASYFGDQVFIANRRLTCQTWASARVPAYCYRFNALTANVIPEIGVTHFQEVSFVFLNLDGVGYVPAAFNPFLNKSESYKTLARFMDSSWISFVSDLNPNSWRSGNVWNGTEALWPKYEIETPQVIVFDANVSSFAEADTWRAQGIDLINANNAGVYHR